MPQIDRRALLAAIGALTLPPALARAAAIDADVRTGTIQDVEHVVILMQENRSFDHYFGTLNGVRGFGDRFPAPVRDAAGRQDASVFVQSYDKTKLLAPFALNSAETFAHMRVEGTPHSWTDAQDAWDEGRMDRWPDAKKPWSMGYFQRADIPFQFALADAFTLCDAYHCATQTGTNTNRLFLWTGTNDPLGKAGGPSISNSHDEFAEKGGAKESYTWTTYPERLLKAGVSWRIYQDMADNFTDNPLAGFKAYRDAHKGLPGSDPRLKQLALSTHHLDKLREDVLAGRLPQVSWVISPAADSEHPNPSSPAQGADYTARVIDALTADPKVWARTVFLVMFDENDGFFDHMPPPSPACRGADGKPLGGSTVDETGMHHHVRNPTEAKAERDDLMGRPYGLGPRVPLYVISPWSRGGWVNSQVFDHTSVVRFLEARFGVMEPNIAPWRRAVCGDLTTCFDFKTPNAKPFAPLPPTAEAAKRANALGRTKPPTPTTVVAPVQAKGTRPSRALPYALVADAKVQDGAARLILTNTGAAAAVLHVYDRLRLDAAPRRYTLAPGTSLEDTWPAGAYDLWVLGPNGFHRRFAGDSEGVEINARAQGDALLVSAVNSSPTPRALSVEVLDGERLSVTLAPGETRTKAFPTRQGWYDVTARLDGAPAWLRRVSGRVETGKDSISDPWMGGPAVLKV
ncbi:phosphocholine-specific phospholipase C [Caulobacter sp. BP25]|uniref:phosphocholine-specific phospholipase C n=1 Tax=Caulobacter sp. BP25 TaxID=2048900 RepID=UPI000C12DAAA|nr:phospholipase C, phosphocholine-specific [Caulobacter sp. BP25]PHY20755.1 phospholipase C, phosphocholine-specific [Caulobacter sp. BP25]